MQIRQLRYTDAEVTDREVILSYKSFSRTTAFDQRILLDKIDSVYMGKTMTPREFFMAIMGLVLIGISLYLLLANPSGDEGSSDFVFGALALISGAILLFLAIILCPVVLGIGIGCRIEAVSFKTFSRTKSRQLYAELLSKLRLSAPTLPPENGAGD